MLTRKEHDGGKEAEECRCPFQSKFDTRYVPALMKIIFRTINIQGKVLQKLTRRVYDKGSDFLNKLKNPETK